jgi:hypothetical protein
MRLGAFLDIGGYIVFIESAMVLFLAVFIGIAVYVLAHKSKTWDAAPGIPLDDFDESPDRDGRKGEDHERSES